MRSQPLISLLREWRAAGLRALALHERQAKALSRREIGQVEALRPHLEALIEEARTLDARRDEAASALASALGVEPKLERIIEALPHAEATALRTEADAAGKTADAVRNAMWKSRTLLENELVYAEGMLGLIAQAVQQPGVYGQATAYSLWVNEVA